MKTSTFTLTATVLMTAATLLQAGPASEKICFETVTATPHETVKSEPIEISGLEVPTKMKLLGRGKYLLNGKEVKERESYVTNGDRVQVVLEADSRENANIRSALVMEDAYDVFTVTTKHDTLPQEKNVNLKCVTRQLGS